MSVFEFNGMFLAIFISVVGFIIGLVTIAVKISSLLNEIRFTNVQNSQIITKILTRLDALEDSQVRMQYNCLRYHPGRDPDMMFLKAPEFKEKE